MQQTSYTSGAATIVRIIVTAQETRRERWMKNPGFKSRVVSPG